jgi:hypothetical protein
MTHPALTERSFQDQVIELARLLGYERIAHFRPGQTRGGRWATQMTGDPGFPDLVLVRPGRVVDGAPANGRIAFIECKVGKNKPTSEQEAWLDALRWSPGIVARVAYPEDLDELAELLR